MELLASSIRNRFWARSSAYNPAAAKRVLHQYYGYRKLTAVNRKAVSFLRLRIA